MGTAGSERPRLPTFLCLNFDQHSIDEYLGGMAALDPTNRYLIRHPKDPIVHDGVIANQRDEETRVYNDWHQQIPEKSSPPASCGRGRPR